MDADARTLIIQIPCFNESQSLPTTLAQLPRRVTGFDRVLWLIIDDGSTDNTVEVAQESGVDIIARHPSNRGLANAFMTGVEAALLAGADVIVNTDADNQYDARDIETLVRPILKGTAEIVVGARPIATTEHFSWIKKRLQRLGSKVVRVASGTQVEDAPSGFRALSREAAMRLNVFSAYTYTLETLIQAGQSNIQVASVPIRTNPDMRPSRLVKSIWRYVWRSALTIVRIFATYRPMLFFLIVSGIFFAASLTSGGWYLYWMLNGEGAGHVQSAIFAMGTGTLGFFLAMLGFLADLIGVNRRLLERLEWRLKRLEANPRIRASMRQNVDD